jgi:hypothetical protein
MTGNKTFLPTGRRNKKPVVQEWIVAQAKLRIETQMPAGASKGSTAGFSHGPDRIYDLRPTGQIREGGY